MKRLVLACAVLLGTCVAQSPTPMRVGVAVGDFWASASLSLRPNASANDTEQRDTLVRSLNAQKPDQGVKVTAVPLTTLDPNGLVAEAQQKNCPYILVLQIQDSDQHETSLIPQTVVDSVRQVVVSYRLFSVTDHQFLPQSAKSLLASPEQVAKLIMPGAYRSIVHLKP